MSPTSSRLLKRTATVAVNVLLIAIIVATILATWMPAIYTSAWFKIHFPKL